MLDKIQNFFKENVHGMLFGFIASIIVFMIRGINDPTVMLVISFISTILGALITYYLKVPKGFFTSKAVMIIFGLISVLIIFGAQTQLFGVFDWLKNLGAKTALSKMLGMGGKYAIFGAAGAFLSVFNLTFAIIAVVLGLIFLGIPLASLINTINKNFVLILIVLGIVLLLSLVMRKK